MDECNFIENDFYITPNIYLNLNAIRLNANISNEQQFRLNKINEIKDYFLAESRERELISKSISKYIACLDYFDRSLNVLTRFFGQYSYCIIYNCYWSTCRNNWSKFWFHVFNYIRICKKSFKNNKK